MADKLVTDRTLYHVHPISDIVRRGVTRNLDCSTLADTPWDGELISGNSGVGARLADATVESKATALLANPVQNVVNRTRMVWGSHRRTDRQANNHAAVAVFNLDMSQEIQLGLYATVDDVTNNTMFSAGTPLVPYNITLAGVKRTALAPARADMAALTAEQFVWAVGETMDTPAAKLAADDDTITVRLWAQPRMIQVLAAQ